MILNNIYTIYPSAELYIILDEPHLAFFTDDRYWRLNPDLYRFTSQKSGEVSMEQTVPGEATPPPPPPPLSEGPESDVYEDVDER